MLFKVAEVLEDRLDDQETYSRNCLIVNRLQETKDEDLAVIIVTIISEKVKLDGISMEKIDNLFSLKRSSINHVQL